MPTILAPILLAAATAGAGQPAIVLTPPSAAPPAPLAARCAPAAQQGDSSEVECLVGQARPGSEPAPGMRIVIRTTPTTPCRSADAQAVALTAAAPAGRGLPEVVQASPEPSCGR